MKRRDFLASAALLSLVANEATAAPAKKKAAPAKKKPVIRRPAPRRVAPPPPPVNSADASLLDNPAPGTSATRLPPVRPAVLPDNWREWEITTRIQFRRSGPALLWLPLASGHDTLHQRLLSHGWQGNAQSITLHRHPEGELDALRCEWPSGGSAELLITTRVATADRQFDITRRTIAPEREDVLRRHLQSSRLIPNDALAHQLGEQIVGRIRDPVAQAKAIFDWICSNASYDATGTGCGRGDVNQQLLSGRFGGRSADINGLFVSLCRAIGIPARCVFGLRIGPSRLSGSLGIERGDATQAQHVRAEFYLPGYGWIPVDAADVLRARTVEQFSAQDPRLGTLRRVLFGVWEMNWLALNHGEEITLPGIREPLPFLARAHLQSGHQSLAELPAEDGSLRITAREL